MADGIPTLIGQFYPHDSFLHRLDPRVKLGVAFALIVIAFVNLSLTGYLLSAGFLIAAMTGAGIGLQQMGRNLRPLVWLVVITVAIHLLFASGEGPYLVEIWFIKISRETLASAAVYSLRLVFFALVSFVLTFTTSPSALAEGFALIIRPLRKLGLRIDRFSLILFIAMRFIPILYEEYGAIKEAQILRGADFGGSLKTKISRRAAILTPLLVGSIRRADEMAVAMAARGYLEAEREGRERTCYTNLHLTFADLSFLILAPTAFVAAFYLGGRIG